MNERILVVDDETKIIKIARDYLEKNGFRVLSAADGKTALAVFRNEKPDLIVLDLMLPEMDGLDVCKAVRKSSEVPIIMLTARSEETDRLIGLEIGADDYISKPFSPRELVARVKAVLRRSQKGHRNPGIIQTLNLLIDLEGHSIKKDGKSLHLTRNEFNILSILARNPGQVLSREQILDHLYGIAYDGFDRSIDAHIKNLRKKLEDDPANPLYIQTVYGIGYKFAEEVF
ncbi:MAG: response regulator transcription factor [Anaerolineaceae bacterium]|nr:response regulator transcription factor [Anaerolineaceae bacterium]